MLLGLDLGTSAVKALLLDERGGAVAEAGAPCPVERPQPGFAETDPLRWWDAVVQSVGALPREPRAQVAAIGLSGQMHGVALCAEDGAPLRPAVLWTDTRARGGIARYPKVAERIAGNAISTGMAGLTLAWLQEHEPQTLSRARWALQAKDWLRLRLTGEAATDPSDASGTLLADRDGRWSREILDALGLPASLLAPLLAPDACAGRLTEGAARALGLPANIPVATGAGDSLAAALGSGLLAEGAIQLSLGTSAQVLVQKDAWPGFSPRLNVFHSANPAGMPRWSQMAAMLNVGGALDWARQVLRLDWDEAYARSFAAEASQSEAIFVPYLIGERTPWMDPSLRGGWVGLQARDDAGSLMRAAFEGVAHGIRAGLDALLEGGAGARRLRLMGGRTTHPAWRQLLADMLGATLEAVSCPNASARGAALLGGLAAGRLAAGDLSALAPSVGAVVEPRPGAGASRHERFLSLHDRLAGYYHGEHP